MIPKIIHYIWLGNNPIPKKIKKCIASWKKICPDYEIKFWNEQNLDLDKYQYVKDAIDNKKYAFASDVLRFDILNNYGGIYLDVDVKLLKPLDKFLDYKFFTGFENERAIAPGLICGCEKGNIIASKMIEYYSKADFDTDMQNNETVCTIITSLLKNKYDIKIDNSTQINEDVAIFSSDYFCPMDMDSRLTHKTKNTVSIHLYFASWMTGKYRFKQHIKDLLNIISFGLFGKWLKRRKNGRN